MPHRHGSSSNYVSRQITLTNELDEAVVVVAARARKSPSEVVRAILSRDTGVAKLLKPVATDLMSVPE